MFFDKKASVGGWNPTRWQSYLFERRIAQGSLRSAVSGLGNAVGGDGVDGDAVCAVAEREASMREATSFGGEVFGRLYGRPERDEGDVGWAVSAHRVLDGLPEFERLQRAVAGDPDFSALATRDLLNVVKEQASNLKKAAEEDRDEDGGEGGCGGSPGDGQPGSEPGQAPGVPTASDMVRSAMRRAIRRIEGDMGDAKSAMNGISPGLEASPPMHQQADPSRYRLAESIKDSDAFQKVMKAAGRLRRISFKAKSQRDRRLNEEVVDIERGGDISRALPGQLAGLRHPLMSKLVKRNIVERSLVQYRLEGSEVKGRGPVVVLLDRSGSMMGEPEVWASAVGIAMAGIAAKEKRAITIVGFNGGITSGFHLDTKGRACMLSGNSRYDIDKQVPVDGGIGALAMHVATEGSGGGTNFTHPLRAALNGLPAGIRDENADLIFVTDGDAYLPEEIMDELNEAKSNGLRVFAMTVNGGSTSEAIQEICDESIDIDAQGDLGVASILGQ